MKTLYLVRHAKSSWDSQAKSDFDRPLNGRGISDANKMADFLKSENHIPDQILCSSARRTHATSKILAKGVGGDESSILEDKGLYLADVNQMQSILRGISDDLDVLWVVAHNPTVTDCAISLTGDLIESIPTCGVFAIELPIDSWLKLRNGVGTRLFFKTPKELSRL